MADTQHGSAPGTAAGTGASAAGVGPGQAAPKSNPALRMMGLPNFRFKLPSRNWLIFWGVIGSWSAALLYDRREKKRIQHKWCSLVAHLALEPLDFKHMPRKVTVVLSAPPADGLMSAREHFHEYVKPVLVASGLDWDVVEGRREGEVRAGLAERIRKVRKRREGVQIEAVEGEVDEEEINRYRERVGIVPEEGIAGDVVIGRNTWKEYIRGLHEGWLGPLEAPQMPVESASEALVETAAGAGSETTASGAEDSTAASPFAADPPVGQETSSGDAEATPSPEKAEEEKPAESKKKKQPPPFIATSAYPTASLPSYIPSELGPCTVIPFPHILGFLNTPIRLKRFLTRRYLAEDVGREVAAVVFAAYRPFDQAYNQSNTTDDGSPTSSAMSEGSMSWEHQGLLQHEEREWHKSIRKDRQEGKESVWLDEPVLDERIAGRMRRFVLEPEQESRARRIKQGTEGAIDRFKEHDEDQN